MKQLCGLMMTCAILLATSSCSLWQHPKKNLNTSFVTQIPNANLCRSVTKISGTGGLPMRLLTLVYASKQPSLAVRMEVY